MVAIYPVSFTSNNQTATQQPAKTDKEKVQDAATVVGGTGYAAKASRMASRRGLQGEKAITEVLDTSRQVMQGTGRTIKEANGFIAKFKQNYKMYVQDATNWFNKFEGTKFIGKIAKSKAARGLASAFGGILAIFVLISGINRAAENGALAICDLKDKYNHMMNN